MGWGFCAGGMGSGVMTPVGSGGAGSLSVGAMGGTMVPGVVACRRLGVAVWGVVVWVMGLPFFLRVGAVWLGAHLTIPIKSGRKADYRLGVFFTVVGGRRW